MRYRLIFLIFLTLLLVSCGKLPISEEEVRFMCSDWRIVQGWYKNSKDLYVYGKFEICVIKEQPLSNP